MTLVSKTSSFLKHLFIPHRGNDYKPHFFRKLALGIILGTSLFLLGLSIGSSFFLHKTILGASIAASVLVDLANESRLAYNEPILVRNSLLDNAAMLKGKDMAQKDYFAHDSPEGVTPWYWFKEVGYVFLYAGENLAINFTESVDVQNAWLNSPKHRDNLLNTNFREIGIATVEGVHKNSPTIFVVQMFGTPALAKKATPKEPEALTISLSKEITTELPQIVQSQKVIPAPAKIDKVAVLTPEVKGDARNPDIYTSSSSETVTPEKPVVTTITETPTLIIVKTAEETEEALPPQVSNLSKTFTQYAPWYGSYVFNGSDYVDTIYKILIVITIIALLTMVIVEMRRQHYKHIAYGAILILVLSLLTYINKAFIS